MDYEEQDSEVVRLLSKLKETESIYPVDMMAARRQTYIKQIAAIGIGTGAAVVLKGAAKAAGSSAIPSIASTVVESVLIVAIVAEASFVAFVNREKVLNIFRTISGESTVQQVTSVPESSLPSHVLTEIIETDFTVTPEPTLAPTLMTETPTLIETPSPDALVATEPTSPNGAGSGDVQVNSTPNPNNNSNTGNNGNNGNHYGQTPRPERTKQSGNNGGNPNQNNNGNNDRNNGNRRGN